MTFAALQALVSGKKPVWLYYIRIGSQTAYLTSHGTDFTVGGQTYTSVAMTQTKIRVTSAIGRAETKVILPQSLEFARNFIGDTGYRDNEILISQTYEEDPDAEVAVKFRGRIVDVRPFYKTITLAAENRFTTFRRKALVDVVQRPCRHVLYHTGCNLSIDEWSSGGTATAWDEASATLTVTEAGEQTDQYYSGGVLTFGTDRQFIVSHVGSNLVLLGPVPDLADEITNNGSAAVSLAPGCNLSMDHCLNKFDNIENYGGFPWITDNLYDGRNPFW